MSQAAVYQICDEKSKCETGSSFCKNQKLEGDWQQSLATRIGAKAQDCLLCELGPSFEREKSLNEQVQKLQKKFLTKLGMDA